MSLLACAHFIEALGSCSLPWDHQHTPSAGRSGNGFGKFPFPTLSFGIGESIKPAVQRAQQNSCPEALIYHPSSVTTRTRSSKEQNYPYSKKSVQTGVAFEFDFEKELLLITCASHPSVVTNRDRKEKTTPETTGAGKKGEANDPHHSWGCDRPRSWPLPAGILHIPCELS